ncbi:MAG TPA: FCD domain-containing protein [Acidimicrobiales bacterium]|nr:FCD domain-containing protein [Acidimicrobiales bacterium]
MLAPEDLVHNGLPTRPGPGSNAKRAARLADRIVEDVMDMGWPVGEVLGAELELLERYQVSRAVFREAVRLLEHQEVARTRRGPGGGLVITEPTMEAVIDAVMLYLLRVDARLDEVFEARILLEEMAAALAAQRLSDADRPRLQEFLESEHPARRADPRALHTLVASCSQNAALWLFVEVVHRVATLYSHGWKSFGKTSEIVHAHSRIAEAILDGDAPTARRRMRVHLEAEAEFLRRRRTTRQILPDHILTDSPGTGKRAETIARELARTVVVNGLQPGDLIGTEAELIEKEKASRAVLREAVRLLEYHRIAAMRRGPGGGLFVVEPDPGAVTDVVAIYLARQGMALSKLSELRSAVEMVIVALAVERSDPQGAARISEALTREKSSGEEERSETIHDLHAALAAVAGNRVLELVALVLIRLSRLHQVERLAPMALDQIRAEILRAHSGIASAVTAGDLDLARRRMGLHLDALAAVIQ